MATQTTRSEKGSKGGGAINRGRRRLLGGGLLMLFLAPFHKLLAGARSVPATRGRNNLQRGLARQKGGTLWLGHRWPSEDE
ncbi:MAG: hypothetical protein JRH20_15840 [Deltaproteobacteria bacterium]|nr:hypothetical protein [Deltaproteobacteria bacterium]